MIMGTSTCHMVLGPDEQTRPGHVRLRRGRHHPRLLRLRGRPVLRRRPLRLVRRALRPRGLPATRRAARGLDIHELLEEKAARPARRGVRPARARLVERQSLGPGRCGADRPAGRRDPRDQARGDLPRADRGDRLRHARDHRDVRGERRPGPRDRRHRRPAREEPADHADLRRRDRPAVPGQRARTRRPRWARPCSGRWPPGRRPAATPPSRTPRAAMARLRAEVYQPDPARHEIYDHAVSRVRAAPRLLRPRRERRHEDPARHASAWRRPARRSRCRSDAMRLRGSSATNSWPLHAELPRERPGRLDRRQRQRPRPGDRPRRDQAVGRPLRGPHGRVDGRPRPRWAHRRGHLQAVVGHGAATSTSTATGRTSTAWSTPTRATRRRSRRSAARSPST